jgi:serine phosphatase RsbU (regulator of sigma subunit)
VRACEAARLLEMSSGDLDRLLQRNPHLAYAVAQVLSQRLNESNNQTIQDLLVLNQELVQANADLLAAQAQLIEKERLDRELQVGREIQRSILPQELPRLPGFDLGAMMEPARWVGGDFYDVIRLNAQKAALVIGDVTDKGIPAAIFMAQTYALIHAAASARLSPRATLLKVNHSLLEMNANGLFATVLYGILDLDTREFQYARAGHEAPVIARQGEAAFGQPVRPGQPLGILERPLIDEQCLTLPAGSVMLLCTDGLTDSGTQGAAATGRSQQPRLMEMLSGLRQSPAQEVCTAIFHAMCLTESGIPQFDDVTVLVVKSA